MKYSFIILLLAFSNLLFSQRQEFEDKYPNGNTRSVGIYKRGMEDSTWRYFYESGLLQEVTNYKMGKFHGAVTQYHPNGKIKIEGYFKEDKQDSIQKTFSEAGKLLEEG